MMGSSALTRDKIKSFILHCKSKGLSDKTIATYEQALRQRLKAPKTAPARKECACYLGGDIGAYNTCGHLCRYCYANYDAETVRKNMRMHDPESPLLIGHLMPGDQVHEAVQESWLDPQLMLDMP